MLSGVDGFFGGGQRRSVCHGQEFNPAERLMCAIGCAPLNDCAAPYVVSGQDDPIGETVAVAAVIDGIADL